MLPPSVITIFSYPAHVQKVWHHLEKETDKVEGNKMSLLAFLVVK